ncbi:hypothetical protein COO91_11033 (plasmid) [Nostoc flagelliforme CCNUN1]|uniref:Uncharacterized protein n=1 Tax=Nostoc flagelliforme CCNUN1 TaxID=2038116 RepID=A0A2K8TAS6_9NOSO|nr:hypothetical protein COO91_11033 [Nostoc flagelliforme CCNUN1]
MQKPFSKRNKPTSTVSAGSEPLVSKTQQDISSQNNQDVVILDVPAVEIPELTEQEQSDKPDGMATLTACTWSVG